MVEAFVAGAARRSLVVESVGAPMLVCMNTCSAPAPPMLGDVLENVIEGSAENVESTPI